MVNVAQYVDLMPAAVVHLIEDAAIFAPGDVVVGDRDTCYPPQDTHQRRSARCLLIGSVEGLFSYAVIPCIESAIAFLVRAFLLLARSTLPRSNWHAEPACPMFT